MREFFAWLYRIILDSVFPIRCLGCRAYDEWICAHCVAHWPCLEPPECPQCRKHSLGWKTCHRCSLNTPLTGLFVLSDYQADVVQRSITKLKYGYVSGIGSVLGTTLGTRWPIEFQRPTSDMLVTAVPLHWQRHNERGFNQAELIADAFAHTRNWPMDFTLIKRKRYTTPQARLDKSGREHNLQGMFAPGPGLDISGKICIIVDDVATTTATLQECAQVLTTAGAAEVWGAVIARSKT